MTGRRARALALALALAPAPALAQPDARLQWRTLETPHFRIHFYQDMEGLARRVAVISEHAVERLAGPLGWRQGQPTQIVLRDSTDDANGSATAVPLNTVQLFVTAPDDLSVLEQYDDWLENLVTHEYAHILHTDHITGIPAIINAIIGKQWAPNQVQPRFILEGLAVYQESLHTRGGRLRSATWDAYLRADALAGTFQTLDQLTVGPNRWPHGNLWYLYGSYLMRYVVERYGAQSLAALSREYGSMAAPWQLNRAIRRVTGATWEEIYEDFQRDTVARYTRQRDALAARGIEEGARLTAQGEHVRNPRFLPDGTLVFESSDGQSAPRLRTLDAAVVAAPPGAVASPTELDRVAGPSGFAPWGDDALLVSDADYHRHRYLYHDLRRWSLARGDDHALTVTEDERLTDGWRAQQPDVHPDGDHAVFTVNHRGTTRLSEMSLTDRRPRDLFAPRPYEQVFAPRYSPDGRTVAFSFWRRGGYRDLWTFDRATRALTQHTHDRALDTSPSYSPDGRWLLWSSDRTGVANVYAMEVATGRVRQVTNSILGAWQPNVSPDGRSLVYLGYSHRGYDLFRLPFDPARWRDPEVVTQDPFGRDQPRDPHPAEDSAPTFPIRLTAYNPWPTLRPRTWSAELTTDGFGPQIALRSESTDIVGRHAWSARVGVGLVRGDPLVDLGYVYRGTRPTVRLRLYRSVDAGGGYRIGRVNPTWAAERIGGESEVSLSFPGRFDQHVVSMTYDAQWVRAFGGLPALDRNIDPSTAGPVFPFEGWLAGLRFSWTWSNAQRFAYSISNQQGVTAYATVRVLDGLIGSSVGGIEASAAVAGYVPMPWGHDRRRHILALHFGAGIGTNDRNERGVFAVGGFPSFSAQNWLDAFRYGVQAGGVALRGYPPFVRGGSQFQLANAEYRFPIWQTQRGVSTLPIFLQRISGDVFVDAGNASYGRFDASALLVGAGAELLVDIVAGYIIPFSARIGFARGFMAEGDNQVYGLFSSPF
jgi:hypothetical protein